jgi:hypothetical protein
MAQVELWQRVLAERERQALIVVLKMRIGAALIAIAIVPFAAGQATERDLTIALFGAVAVACGVGIRAAPRLGNNRALALLGAIVDSILLCCLVGIWHLSYTGPESPVVHLLGHQFTLISLLLIVINAVSLRPLHPLAVPCAGASTR